MRLYIHPDNPQPRLITQVADVIRKGGIIIYPTDTLYAFGCDPFNPKAVERICQLKGIRMKDARFSLVCCDLSDVSKFVKSLDTATFRMLKAALPGPFTFILPASKETPKLLKVHRDTVGIRVPDHPICNQLVEALERPIMSGSLPENDDEVEYFTDPDAIYERFGKQVDLVIDSGAGPILGSTVIDLSHDAPEVLREGAGDSSLILTL
ncbi:MAG: threonylcarbamoyl-AMP synthase [Sphingobacteriales bacterium]|nr:MAG: threonylcarbamoyl-AMP synthase [Sphingobacteriales bacterium]